MASELEGITKTVLSTTGKIDMAERQWRRALGIGVAAARASTDNTRSRGESYSDSSESAPKALVYKTGSGIRSSDAVWWQITILVRDTKPGSAEWRITGEIHEIGLERPQEQEKTTFKGRS